MDFLAPTMIVFAMLLVVAIAALSFESADPFAAWVKLAERYGTERRPTAIQFAGQRIRFGGQRGKPKDLNAFVTFDATIDDFGLWIICNGIDEEQFPAALKIPGTHVRLVAEKGNGYVFDLYAEPPVRMVARGELGQALAERSRP
ncbi:MAG: hypothetical protein KJP08_01000 [Gammaproteobacteria bacterium]|nr:hypothetical protein [Gammaproteobacteria bacterium]NNF50561.1 hypothetical protein [Woeseiaceae bacterium]MBT8093360.1 hypothetical protein [Gammaproteobacteria bacterium]MBT8104385.1 hypothetical protein [Gammaproteobacteria bacterium]NNK24401.1 hypothetical protein [Woeseiaceae bacterium]